MIALIAFTISSLTGACFGSKWTFINHKMAISMLLNKKFDHTVDGNLLSS